MKNLKEHLSSQAYYLTYESEPVPTIVFHIRGDMLEDLKRIPLDNWHVKKGLERLGDATTHQSSFEKDWGFSRKTVNRGWDGEFLVLAFPLQPFFSYSEYPCERCEGTGQELFDKGRKCSDCRGTGKDTVGSNEQGKITESMSLLLKYIEISLLDNRDTGRFDAQDIHVVIVTHIANRKPIGGEINEWLFDQFETFRDKVGDRCPEAKKVMSDVYAHLMVHEEEGRKRHNDYCRAEMHRYGFHLEVPMNATYLHVDDHGPNIFLPKGRTTMSDHNVDSSPDQMSLLAGCVVFYHKILASALS
jgi:hypothetical protein